MLEHHGDAGDRLGDARIAHQNLAGIMRQQAVDTSKKRGLAAAGGPDHREDLALADFEVDVAEHFQRAVALGEAPDADARFAFPRGGRGSDGGRRRLLVCHFITRRPVLRVSDLFSAQ